MSNTSIKMSKYQGLGNDYLVLDPNKNKTQLVGKRISLLCKRGFGIGADGILYGPILDGDKISVKIFNPDGSETAASGNGIRIFAKYLMDQQYVTSRNFTVYTDNGPLHVESLNDRGTECKVEMGKATFVSTEIPVTGEEREVVNEPFLFHDQLYNATCTSVGNPHCVIMMENVSKETVKDLGPYVENAPQFPNRMNLQIIKVIDRANIQMEIYERGAGYTLASGTGSCAAAAVARRLGLVDKKVNVHQPGGTIEIETMEDGTMYMIGSVEFIADLSVAEEFLS
ncbi:MAG: diaminopimelate epimerase [Lachnospiraceae bacterium]|nr:diaminopimelate epimerase [Lachnospiraceae bacterium]MDD3616835.1 diaminopimelate epimerase [Lachnospiraceae bacterium]